MLNSPGSRGAELGSPAKTTICFPNAVMLWPDRADGDGPMFWNVYQRREVIRKAARSPKSVPSFVRPPKIYMTSPTSAAECPSRGAGMYPIQSSCDQAFCKGSYDHTSLNHWVAFVPPNLRRCQGLEFAPHPHLTHKYNLSFQLTMV